MVVRLSLAQQLTISQLSITLFLTTIFIQSKVSIQHCFKIQGRNVDLTHNQRKQQRGGFVINGPTPYCNNMIFQLYSLFQQTKQALHQCSWKFHCQSNFQVTLYISLGPLGYNPSHNSDGNSFSLFRIYKDFDKTNSGHKCN